MACQIPPCQSDAGIGGLTEVHVWSDSFIGVLYSQQDVRCRTNDCMDNPAFSVLQIENDLKEQTGEYEVQTAPGLMSQHGQQQKPCWTCAPSNLSACIIEKFSGFLTFCERLSRCPLLHERVYLGTDALKFFATPIALS